MLLPDIPYWLTLSSSQLCGTRLLYLLFYRRALPHLVTVLSLVFRPRKALSRLQDWFSFVEYYSFSVKGLGSEPTLFVPRFHPLEKWVPSCPLEAVVPSGVGEKHHQFFKKRNEWTPIFLLEKEQSNLFPISLESLTRCCLRRSKKYEPSRRTASMIYRIIRYPFSKHDELSN